MPAGVDEKEVEVFQREEKVGDVGHHNCRALERLVQLVKSSAVLSHALYRDRVERRIRTIKCV